VHYLDTACRCSSIEDGDERMSHFIQYLIHLGTPRRFYHFCGKLFPWFMGFSFIAMAYGLIGGLFLAPADYQQGDGFRIIYVHVPCAFLSMFIYMTMVIFSTIFLIWRIKLADLIAYSIAPVGAVFTLCALLTGSIWGKPMWGTWWIWDARLTSELILLFLYLGYLGLYQAITEKKLAARMCAILAVVGAIDIPIIHYSVYWWNTLHQGATISQWGKPAIDMTMLKPLLSMITGFALYTMAISCIRIRTEILQRDFKLKWVNVLVKKINERH